MSPAFRAAAGGRPGRLRSALLALSAPLLILLALLALLHRTGSDRMQAEPREPRGIDPVAARDGVGTEYFFLAFMAISDPTEEVARYDSPHARS